MSTFSSTTVGISLTLSLQNPATIVSGATVSNSTTTHSGDGVYGSIAAAWNITNYGTISATRLLSKGVDLRAGGTVTNTSTAQIAGFSDGVYIRGGVGTVENFGTIRGSGIVRSDAKGTGVYLGAGGTVINDPSGSIIGNYTGVWIRNAPGTIINSGTVAGTDGPAGAGIFLNAGGYVANMSLGVIAGYYRGIGIVSSGTVANSGTISSFGSISYGIGIAQGGGGVVTNSSAGVISGGSIGVRIALKASAIANVVNDGTISAANAGGLGVSLGIGSVINHGTIVSGINGTGVYVLSGAISNLGTIIAAGELATAVDVRYGNVSNSSSGAIIAAGSSGTAVSVANGTFFNSGLVQGRVSGIQLTATSGAPLGRVNVSGTVVGATGITVQSGTASQTLTVGGSVIGSSGTAVSLTNAGSDRLILAPGAAFQGKVDGGGGNSVVEVATALGGVRTADTAAATIYIDLGSVTNFSALQVDSGATANTGGSISFDTLVNQGQINLLAGDSLLIGTVAASGGTIDLKSGGSVHIAGAVAAGQTVLFRPPGGSVALDHPEQFAGTISEFASTDLIDLPLGAASFQQYAGGVLSFAYGGGKVALRLTTAVVTPQFFFSPDGQGGTDITVSAAGSLAGMITLSAATERTALASSTTVATFTDTNANDQAGGFNATIDWGDGSTNTGAVTGSNGSFTVSGSHTYADEGSEPLSVTIIRAADNAQIAPSGTLTVAEDDSFTPQPVTFAPTMGQPFTGTVAVFGDSDVLTLSDDLTASIDWGDGASQTQGMVTGSNGSFTVSGAHTYVTAGQRPVTVTLFDDGSGTGNTIATSTANVTACFCRGTMILTESGEVAVEDLEVGDRVRTLSGTMKPIVWIGFGRDLVTRANRLARPVIVRQNALADNVPHRDLYLTHGHALYLDETLIPVEHLVNHRSILWDDEARVVEYYHIELDDHDVLFAEGAPAESYHDAGNRALFHNARPGSAAAAAGVRPTFAPVLQGGDRVEAAWARLLAHAGGPAAGAVTADPDLHLLVDGVRIEPLTSAGGVYCFMVPRPPAASLRLCSRSGVPSLLGLSRSDHRPLGVAITQLMLEQEGIATWFDYDQLQLREAGCYRHEDGFAWTDGELALTARFFPPLADAFTLFVHTEPHPDMRYPIAARLANAA